jgi:branched-chain amino acid transport system substrate-binding protein
MTRAVTTRLSRRKFLAATGATAVVPAIGKPAIAQQAPLKVGLMTVKTGGLAAGGVHLEEGITCFLRDKNFTLAGRKIELIVADTAGRSRNGQDQSGRTRRARQGRSHHGPARCF